MVVSSDTESNCILGCSNSPTSVLAERRFVSAWSDCHRLTPCSSERKAGSAARNPHSFQSLAEGITGHVRSSSAAEFSGLCPPPSFWQENILPRGIVLTQTISQGNRWLNWQELLPRDFGTNQGLKSVDILCVFQRFQAAELGQKIRHQPKAI